MKLSPVKATRVPPRVFVLSSGIFALSVCSFAVVPLLALYLANSLHTPADRIGVVLAVSALANQGTQIGVGMLVDRLGNRIVFTGGIALACLGYIGFSLGPDFAGQLACGLVLGLGRAVLSLVGKTMLAEEAGEERASALTLRTMAVNAGASIGPIIGAQMIGGFRIMLLSVAVVLALIWAVMVRFASNRPHQHRRGARLRDQVRQLAGNRALVGLTVASVGFWFLYTQFTFTFPLFAEDRFAMRGGIGLLFALNAVLVVLLQYFSIAWIRRRGDGWSTIAAGCACIGAGFLVMALIGQVWALVAFVVLFSVGELVVSPMLDIVTTEVSPKSSIGGSFGFASLGWAAGGLLGNTLGGIGYQALKPDALYGFWLIQTVVAAVTVAGFLVLRRKFGVPSGPTETEAVQ